MGSRSDLNVMQDAADILKELGVSLRDQCSIGPPHTRPYVQLCQGSSRTRLKSNHCRGGRRSPFAGHGGIADAFTGNRRPRKIKQLHRRLGFDPVYPANAQWYPGSNRSP